MDVYSPPKAGLLSHLPPSWVPYAELARIDRPTGVYYLLWPCIWSTLFAAAQSTPTIPLSDVGRNLLLWAVGCYAIRVAACAINDIQDRKIDPLVTRTKFRPLARKAIPVPAAVVFAGAHLLLGLAVLLQFPRITIPFSGPSFILIFAYGLSKRVTDYPQVVLGFFWSSGVVLGFPALGINPLDESWYRAVSCLYLSNIFWTILYDTIYAYMDLKDDRKAGIRSIAVAHAKDSKSLLWGLALSQIVFLVLAGWFGGLGIGFFVAGCGSAAVSLVHMVRTVDLADPASCWWWFKNGCLITGSGIALGFLNEYLVKIIGQS